MLTIYTYSVFAAVAGGGKRLALVEGVSDLEQMQQIASRTGVPLTGFILNAGARRAEVRFFSPDKEKGASDSGALVVGEHLRLQGAIQERLWVQMGKEGLEVSYQDGKWWSHQEDTWEHKRELDVPALAAALDLDWQDINWDKGISVAGNSKLNIIVPVAFPDQVKPDFEAISEINRRTGTNGVVVFSGPGRTITFDPSRRGNTTHDIELRFFAPAKGIPEDNAGSYTISSLCGYLAWFWQGEQQYEVLQGAAMGRPSRLYMRYRSDGQQASYIQVGGKVEPL
ncbi:PhzF family phenazine biosynthesis protein [Meiothermus granaticius]|uniref:Trans-2,3-dihydro-3-hydroxyanthranilate isomerase n=1 Tax=Meiothermus granaticius NBRC 107808 TaxID=1227551 RepID=A0A399FCX4_9DEIN|nr:PhzF family phenazine biosynthesis protein [Meiothermus granaticius]RIH93585.1 Trans-2,3-dihydro-3-hydroxyanthranilate isomerase [Meiothermus granaticius NBRC 107808]GEM87223.1 trans-2,3-dihydro-3-hydroxyanthranilate isomerase [Meiothermus granaticius NBRC 107808]